MARRKHKGQPRFFALPNALTSSALWNGLEPSAMKLFIAIASQYNGRNNGDLHCAISEFRKQGWRVGTNTLVRAKQTLLDLELIYETRSGYFKPGAHKRCALYAISFQDLDECEGKDLEVKAPNAPHRTINQIIKNIPNIETAPSRVLK